MQLYFGIFLVVCDSIAIVPVFSRRPVHSKDYAHKSSFGELIL